jgi:hypothetical protein
MLYMIQDSPTDYEWGCGNGTGKNFLGIILMQTRAHLRNNTTPECISPPLRPSPTSDTMPYLISLIESADLMDTDENHHPYPTTHNWKDDKSPFDVIFFNDDDSQTSWLSHLFQLGFVVDERRTQTLFPSPAHYCLYQQVKANLGVLSFSHPYQFKRYPKIQNKILEAANPQKAYKISQNAQENQKIDFDEWFENRLNILAVGYCLFHTKLATRVLKRLNYKMQEAVWFKFIQNPPYSRQLIETTCLLVYVRDPPCFITGHSCIKIFSGFNGRGLGLRERWYREKLPWDNSNANTTSSSMGIYSSIHFQLLTSKSCQVRSNYTVESRFP